MTCTCPKMWLDGEISFLELTRWLLATYSGGTACYDGRWLLRSGMAFSCAHVQFAWPYCMILRGLRGFAACLPAPQNFHHCLAPHLDVVETWKWAWQMSGGRMCGCSKRWRRTRGSTQIGCLGFKKRLRTWRDRWLSTCNTQGHAVECNIGSTLMLSTLIKACRLSPLLLQRSVSRWSIDWFICS